MLADHEMAIYSFKTQATAQYKWHEAAQQVRHGAHHPPGQVVVAPDGVCWLRLRRALCTLRVVLREPQLGQVVPASMHPP